MMKQRRSNAQLTVAHFMPWSEIGGTEIATLRMTEATKAQFRHVAFCLQDASSLKDSFKQLGIETFTYEPPTPSLRHASRFFKESRVIARQLKQVGADIVHFADEKAAYHNSLSAVLARARIVCHLRVSNPRLSFRRRLCLSPVQSFIFVSKEAKETFAFSLPDKKARVIYDAIDIPGDNTIESREVVRQELGILSGCTVVGTVARVNAQKDYFTLALAAAEVLRKFPETLFLIVGDNSLVELNRQHYKEVVQRLEELGIRGNFIFTGHRTDVSRLIAAMDICVLCTHREGFPLSILETMAMRKPVLATAVGGIPEIVEPGVTGYLHQHENDQELAAAIIHLIEHPEEAKRIGLAAHAHVLQYYSRERFAGELSQAYSDLMRL